MQKLPLVLAAVMLGSVMGCNIQIPNQLLNQFNPDSGKQSPDIEPSVVNDDKDRVRQFGIADTNRDQTLDRDEFLIWTVSASLRNAGSIDASAVEAEFQFRDGNGDKQLNLQEFVRRLPIDWNVPKPKPRPSFLEPQPPLDACVAGFKRADANRDGFVNFEEFARADYKPPMPDMPRPAVMPPKEEILDRFKGMDRNGDSLIDIEEWCTDAPSPGDGDCKAVFTRADVNGDGVIDFEEFARADYKPPMPDMPRPAVMPPKEEILDRFKGMDRNGDGLIDIEEWCTDAPLPGDGDCKAVFMRADVNGDGVVDFEEFARADYKRPMMPGTAMATVMPTEDELRRRFKGLDRNGDALLDGDEWCSDGPVPVEPPIGPEPLKPLCDGWLFGTRDSVTFEEMYTYYQRETVSVDVTGAPDASRLKQNVYDRFGRLDRDRDGRVTQAEFCNAFEVAPKPTDDGETTCNTLRWPGLAGELLSYQAYAKWRFSAIVFRQQPSPEQVDKLIRGFTAEAERLDTNRDQRVSLEEERSACAG